MKDIIKILEARGFLDTLSEDISDHLQLPRKIYIGFDPTADSLHIGNLVGILTLKHLQSAGHTPVVIFGGATAAIGDPSGKTKERPLLSLEQIKNNIMQIRKIFENILDFSDPKTKPILLNNNDWIGNFSFLEFLRDVGKNYRLGPMLAKEMVKTRLESAEGLSFTEFSYQILQGYDFYHLFDTLGVSVQFGGSDQWGNIVSGIELVRKKAKHAVYGATWPLLTKSDGTKFGKTESGAVWLTEEKTSVFEFYQFFIRQADQDVIALMKALTFLEPNEIATYEKELSTNPTHAQKVLAFEVTKIVHGEEKAIEAKKASLQAKPGAKMELTQENLEKLKNQIPTFFIKESDFINSKVIDLLVELQVVPSKSNLRRLMENGGFNINEVRQTDQHYTLSHSDLVEKFCLIGIGKKNKFLLVLE